MSRSGNFFKFVATSVILFAFVVVGFLMGRQGHTPALQSTAYASPSPAFFETASSGKSLSFATGLIEDGLEGLYGLDHLTGDLFCWIVNPRSGEVASTFAVNVNRALGVDGDADFVMATGKVDFRIANTGGNNVAQSVIYVGDGNSGAVVGYVLQYDRQAISRGNASAGQLEPICEMLTREPGTVREQGNRKGR